MASTLLAFALYLVAQLAVAQNSFTCPSSDGQTVTDTNGVQYVIGCADDSTNGNFAQSSASSSFNDCFQTCSTNGVGSGTCYLKSPSFESFTSGNVNMVAAIKMANYVASSNTVSTWSGPTWACPAQDRTMVTDSYGIQWIIGCYTDISVGSYASRGTSYGFDDCFSWCSNGTYPTTAGAGYCDAFTYVGGTNGVGSGTCYYKNGALDAFSGSNSGLIAAVQMRVYTGAAPTSTLYPSGASSSASSTASSTTSSAASSAAAAAATTASTISSTITLSSRLSAGASAVTSMTVSYITSTATSYFSQTTTSRWTVNVAVQERLVIVQPVALVVVQVGA